MNYLLKVVAFLGGGGVQENTSCPLQNRAIFLRCTFRALVITNLQQFTNKCTIFYIYTVILY